MDFGRELYAPWRLAEGGVLFRDLAWFNGPLSPHWNALLFRLFGPGLSVLVWGNVLVLAGTVAMLHRLVARVSDELTATSAGLVFLLVFAFGQYVGIGNYNWITPYSHEATHGVALAVAALFALDRSSRTGSVRAAAVGGLALGLCFLTKPETFLAGAAGCLVFLVEALRTRKRRIPVVFAAAMLIPIVISLVWFGPRGTIGAWPPVLDAELSRMPYYRSVTGFDVPGERSAEMIAWASVWLLVVITLGAVAWLARETRTLRVPVLTGVVVLGAAVWLGDAIPWGDVLRPLPLVSATLALVLVARMRSPDPAARPTTALALTVFGLALLAKVVLHVRVAHYGFALAMPASLVAVAALVCWLPWWLDQKGIRGAVVRAGALALLAAFAWDRVQTTQGFLAAKTEVVGSGRDAFRSDVRGTFVNGAVAQVQASAASSLAVVPEGVMINYLARVPNPTPYINFMPPEEVLFGDGAWAAAFTEEPPDVVVMVPKDTSEFGRGPFALGYGRALGAFIGERYTLRSVVRVEGIPFEIHVLGLAAGP